MLDAMAARGVYQAVVSNKTGKYLRAEAEALGWTSRFGKLIGANDAPRDKPDVAPVLLALESTNIRPSQEVWFVGDSDIDMQCAHNGGMTGVLIPPQDEDAGENQAETALFPPAVTFSSCEAFSVLVSRSFAPI